ncbi:MAG: hypothetical protein QGE94_05730 [Desulfobacterales bacterium]|nr:hypothetical protein [Desulfobacterales bacterium]
MNKVIYSMISVVLLLMSPALAYELKVGMKASDWSFEDSKKNIFTMANWAGKVLLVNYVDPDIMKKAKDEGRLKDETYRGIRIADCAAT